jgi:hypothetical protein
MSGYLISISFANDDELVAIYLWMRENIKGRISELGSMYTTVDDLIPSWYFDLPRGWISYGDTLLFDFQDERDAMMFKLAWG